MSLGRCPNCFNQLSSIKSCDKCQIRISKHNIVPIATVKYSIDDYDIVTTTCDEEDTTHINVAIFINETNLVKLGYMRVQNVESECQLVLKLVDIYVDDLIAQYEKENN